MQKRRLYFGGVQEAMLLYAAGKYNYNPTESCTLLSVRYYGLR